MRAYMLLFIGLVLILITPSFAEEPYRQLHSTSPAIARVVPPADPERDHALAEIQGTVESVDTRTQRLRIKDTVDQPVTVRIIPETRIMSSDNKDLKLSDLHPDDRVRLYYSKADGTARQIDRLPTPGAVLMGGQ
jgi:hypothetical protein